MGFMATLLVRVTVLAHAALHESPRKLSEYE
jgi:hypothetical protein